MKRRIVNREIYWGSARIIQSKSQTISFPLEMGTVNARVNSEKSPRSINKIHRRINSRFRIVFRQAVPTPLLSSDADKKTAMRFSNRGSPQKSERTKSAARLLKTHPR